MTFRERVQIWWGLGWYWKWELLGVYAHMRCSACGDWYWNHDPCHTDDHTS